MAQEIQNLGSNGVSIPVADAQVRVELGTETLPDPSKTVKGNINALSNSLTLYTSENMTKNDGGNYIKTEYSKMAYKYNLIKIIHLSFAFKPITTVNAWTTIYTIPQGYIPINNMSIMCITNANKYMQVRVTTNGELQFYTVNSIASDELLSCEIIYI